MASKHGRLYVKKSTEGTHAEYEDAYKSAFETGNGRSSANFTANKPRFHTREEAPDVELPDEGFGATAQRGAASSVFTQNKPRFAETKPAMEDYEQQPSSFESVPQKSNWNQDGKGRFEGWIKNKHTVEAPDAEYEVGGSSFDNVAGVKPSANFTANKPRFHTREEAPDVELPDEGFGATAQSGAASSVFTQNKPRFAETKPALEDYEEQPSSFESVPQKSNWNQDGKGRFEGWIKNKHTVEAPDAEYEVGGSSFDNVGAGRGSGWSQAANKSRFNYNNKHTAGDPGDVPERSAFEGAMNARPHPSMECRTDRFQKHYNVPSHGDPGAYEPGAAEQAAQDAKLARQRMQAEIAAQRQREKYAQMDE